MGKAVGERFIELIAEMKSTDPAAVAFETELACLGLDDLELIELLFAADERFGLMDRLAVHEDGWIEARTVADLVALLEKAGAR